jgi:drug/metabolite transporter (DMT)-like permease
MLLFAALIAGAFSIGKQAAPFIDPAALTALRFLCAFIVMGMALLILRVPVERRHAVAPFEALKTAQPVSTSAIFTLIPAMSAGFGWMLMRQRFTPVAQLALVIGAIGAVWVIFRADPGALLALDIGRGETVFFFGCILHALYAPMVPRLNRGEPVLVFSLGTILGALVVVGLYAMPAILATDWSALPRIVWITVAYLAIFTTAGTFALLQFAALRLPSGKVMAYGYLVPAFVALYEGLLGNGWPAALVWAGVGLILCALLILLFGRD